MTLTHDSSNISLQVHQKLLLNSISKVMCFETVQEPQKPENKRKYPFLFIGVLTATVVLVITGFIFIITLKR